MTTRKILSFIAHSGFSHVDVRFNPEYQEYSVEVYALRVKQENATYFTDDKQDAIGTAKSLFRKAMAAHLPPEEIASSLAFII